MFGRSSRSTNTPSGGGGGGWGEKPSMPLARNGAADIAAAGGARGVFRVAKGANTQDAITNCVSVNPSDFGEGYVICDDAFVFKTQLRDNQPRGHIGMGMLQREWGGWSLNQEILVAPYSALDSQQRPYLESLDVEVGFLSRTRTTDQQFDQEEMAALFKKSFMRQPFAPSQRLVFDFKSFNLRAIVRTIQLTDLSFDTKDSGVQTSDPRQRGILTDQTAINFFRSGDSDIRIKASSRRPAVNAIIQPDFKFENMGIGGLDSEFSAIFRRAFASRIFPPGLVEKIGIQHVKGILLYGPPGTGKTLIARQIGKMLNAREPKIVNGPEILNKFVGQSEENVRKLFADAEKEYKEKGDESGLHIIIFDELDAICKQRGSRGDSTGTGDQVVNQLLAKMDGVDQLNNILVIGMTNRKDMIDEALLRPGRLEVHVEISLPDEAGRKQILKIHTAKMSENSMLGDDVNLDELATLTKNFSGAEISGLIKSASSFAFNRHVKVGTVAGISNDVENMKIMRDDFMHALDEVHPAFGVSEEELGQCVRTGIIEFGPHIREILAEGNLFVEQVRNSKNTRLLSVLLHGPVGSGKTALAATIALRSKYPFIKLISPEAMIGMSEPQKVSYISRVFEDSYKSPQSVVVVDKLERLLDWVNVGPRFSNIVLQALMVLFRRQPPKDRRLLILATTAERTILSQMDMLSCFDADIPIPNVSTVPQLDAILKAIDLFDDKARVRVLEHLHHRIGEGRLGIGIARILTLAETARQDEETASRFVDLIEGAIMA